MTDRATPSVSRRAPWERLTAFHACHELALQVYRTTRRWPRAEQQCLTLETRQAAISAVVGLVQAATERGTPQFRRCLDQASGSLARLSCLLLLARDLELLSQEGWGEVEAKRDHAARLTWGLNQAAGRRVSKPRSSSDPS